MRISSSVLAILALASPLFLLDPVAAASQKRLKGRERLRRIDEDAINNGNEKKKVFKGRSKNEISGDVPKRRKLNGKGKGKGSPDDDFYRFSCEFCGQGNDSALNSQNGGVWDCFSKDMTVQVLGSADPVAMGNLRVGDQVLTQDGSYEPIYAFGHYAPLKEATFYQIYTTNKEKEKPLEITKDHLVYLSGRDNPVRAKSLKVGDVLQSSSNNNHQKTTTIEKIEMVQKTGIYAPLTYGGNLVVNGVVASSYISLQEETTTTNNNNNRKVTGEYLVLQGSKIQVPIMSHQQYVDMTIAPYRLMCRVTGSALCDTTTTGSTNKEGVPTYIAHGIAINLWSSRHLAVHPWIVLGAILTTGPFWLLERTLLLQDGIVSMAVLAVFFMAVLVRAVMKKQNLTVKARKVKSA